MSNTPVSGSERIIDQILAEAGLEDADDLRPVLLELRSLGTEQPEPSSEVLALMAGGRNAGPTSAAASSPAPPSAAPSSAARPSADLNADKNGAGTHDAGSTVVVDLAARRRNKRRLPLTALGVAAALAVGGGAAAAADQGVRDTLHQAFSSIAATFGAGHQGSPKNQTVPAPGETDGDFQGTQPSPAVSAPTTSSPAGSPDGLAHPGQDVRSPAPGAGPGRSSGNPWLKRTPPAIPDVPGAPAVPAPALTPPAVGLPSVPGLPTPERADGATPQP
jgi:hypothetical protein